MARFRKFWYLTGREKLTLFEACILLLFSNLSVKMVAFRSIDSYLHAYLDNRRDAIVPSNDIKNEIELVDLSLSRAANALPWNSLCLSRSIAQLIMLRRRGIPAILFAGVKSADDSSLSAHAWVRAGDIVMDGTSGQTENGEYTVLVTIGQKPLPNSSRNSV